MPDFIVFLFWVVRNIAPLLILLVFVLAYWIWRRLDIRARTIQREALAVALTLLAFGLIDWILLSGLPALGLSFGPVVRNWTAISLLRALALIGLYFIFVQINLFARKRANPGKAPQNQSKNRLVTLWLVNLSLLGLAIYSLYIEPFDLRVSEISLPGPALEAPLRIVHISDIHVERTTKRERQMLETVAALEPDLILLTGDYLNIDYKYDPLAQHHGRELLAQLSAPYGVFAVAGTRGVDPPEVMQALFQDLDIQVLDDRVYPLSIDGNMLYLVGVATRGRTRDIQVLNQLMAGVPEDAYSVLLYHTPDLIEAAAENKVDLYLAGHTHGGQVRLPFYGALVTMSYYGKQYESGLYVLAGTTIYISRGVGMEGLGLPRLRFLCPPEIVSIDLERQ